ncbi:hypothetical protein ACIQ7D_17990 [Streptomyces sp. NPDC096310]|uniref:hypothetical protein n=1 Tax=Streptomyces sp. NPDC096310 TaxID=3366082 RepID=UPI0037F91656
MSTENDPLEAAFAAPPAQIGPTSPLDELRAAADVLRKRDSYEAGALALWLHDTALVHGPDDDGRTCFRDGEDWPCLDVNAAQKVAFAVGYATPTP